MTSEWSPQETNTHQDHVIAHLLGATVLGYFETEQAVHLLLDMGFIWTVYVDGEMGLLPQGVAIAELEVEEGLRAMLREETQALHDRGLWAQGLRAFTIAPVECLITEVTLEARGREELRILVSGEEGSLAIETSLITGEVQVHGISPN
ncbi:MAG TPA: hypothetical protein VF544_13395 [Pyrinomonadaceae bacterium]|jgi:hypothetical protein